MKKGEGSRLLWNILYLPQEGFEAVIVTGAALCESLLSKPNTSCLEDNSVTLAFMSFLASPPETNCVHYIQLRIFLQRHIGKFSFPFPNAGSHWPMYPVP